MSRLKDEPCQCCLCSLSWLLGPEPYSAKGSAAFENPFLPDSVPVYTVDYLSEEVEGTLGQVFTKNLEISKEQMTEKP